MANSNACPEDGVLVDVTATRRGTERAGGRNTNERVKRDIDIYHSPQEDEAQEDKG